MLGKTWAPLQPILTLTALTAVETLVKLFVTTIIRKNIYQENALS